MRKKPVTFFLATTAIMISFGTIILFQTHGVNDLFVSQTANVQTTSKTAVLHPSYAADYSDDRILMGASHDIFIGKVVRKVGDKSLMDIPKTQFEVKILLNIKGDLHGMVIVDQLGGYSNGKMFTEHAAPLLKIGSTYLLSTRYNKKEDWYTFNGHPNAWKIISEDGSLDDLRFEALMANDKKVQTLEATYPNEKLLDADIAHANTRNSFQSLQPEAKAAAVARADVARAWLEANKETR